MTLAARHPAPMVAPTGALRVIACLAALLALACPAAAPGAPLPAGPVLRLGGSGGPMAAMPALLEEYRRQTGDSSFTFQPTNPVGSGGGVKALLAGSLEVAVTSRPLTREERDKGAVGTRYAVTPFILAAPPDRSLFSLTRGEFARVLAGEVTSWPDGRPIRLVLRPEADTDTMLLRQFSPLVAAGVDAAMKRQGMVFANNDLENTERLEATPGSLGTTTLSQVVAERRRLVPIPLEGVAPSLDALQRGTWRLRKEFFAVLGPASPKEAGAFVRWLASPQAEPALRNLGMAPPR